MRTLTAIFLTASVLLIGCAPKDADIQANIQKELENVSGASGVTVSVSEGIATLAGEVQDPSVKDKVGAEAEEEKGVKSVVNNCTVAPPPPPVQVNDEASLSQGVTDATKDFPTVTATVVNSEITLTGSIARSDLQTLMQSLNSLNPRKINNQLTIK